MCCSCLKMCCCMCCCLLKVCTIHTWSNIFWIIISTAMPYAVCTRQFILLWTQNETNPLKDSAQTELSCCSGAGTVHLTGSQSLINRLTVNNLLENSPKPALHPPLHPPIICQITSEPSPHLLPSWFSSLYCSCLFLPSSLSPAPRPLHPHPSPIMHSSMLASVWHLGGCDWEV